MLPLYPQNLGRPPFLQEIFFLVRHTHYLDYSCWTIYVYLYLCADVHLQLHVGYTHNSLNCKLLQEKFYISRPFQPTLNFAAEILTANCLHSIDEKARTAMSWFLERSFCKSFLPTVIRNLFELEKNVGMTWSQFCARSGLQQKNILKVAPGKKNITQYPKFHHQNLGTSTWPKTHKKKRSGHNGIFTRKLPSLGIVSRFYSNVWPGGEDQKKQQAKRPDSENVVQIYFALKVLGHHFS